jgi:hypothetical protein
MQFRRHRPEDHNPLIPEDPSELPENPDAFIDLDDNILMQVVDAASESPDDTVELAGEPTEPLSNVPPGEPDQSGPRPTGDCAPAELPELEAIIQRKDAQIAAYEQQLHELNERVIHENSALSQEISMARDKIAELNQRLYVSELARDAQIEKLMSKSASLEAQLAHQKEHIRRMKIALDAFQESQPKLAAEFQWRPPPVAGCIEPIASKPSLQEKQVMCMFYQGEYLGTIANLTNLDPEEIFRMLQALIVPPNSQVENTIPVPTRWTVHKAMLLETVNHYNFLFSTPVLQGFDACDNPHQLAELLAQAFRDFSRQEDPNWPAMALVVMELATKTVVRLTTQKTREELEQRVDSLESTKGKLLVDCKHLSDRLAKFLTQQRVRAAQRKATHDKEIEDLRASLIDLETVRPSRSAIRGAVLREMVHLAQSEASRRYPDIIYYWAVVILFRSRSCYEYVHEFFPSPVPSAIYKHFDPKLKASAGRLKSLDQVEP